MAPYVLKISFDVVCNYIFVFGFFCCFCDSLSFSLLLLFLGLATFVYSRTITIIIHYLMLLVVFEISSFCSIWASAAFLSAASIFAQINAQCAMAHYTVSNLCMPTEHVLHFEKLDRSFIKTLREVIPKKKREKKLSLFLAAGEYCIRWITNRNLWNDYLNHAYQQLIVDRHLCAASLGCFFFHFGWFRSSSATRFTVCYSCCLLHWNRNSFSKRL